MRVVLFGPPGAGKGTQAALIANKYCIPHLSTGEVFRAAVSSGTELGGVIHDAMNSGLLVEDGLVISIIDERLSMPDCTNGFVLDGFPRTLVQAAALDDILSARKECLSSAIELSVLDDVLFSRIKKRVKTDIASGEIVRDDDSLQVFRIRLSEYYEKTKLLSGYYEGSGLLSVIDGSYESNKVFNSVNSVLSVTERADAC